MVGLRALLLLPLLAVGCAADPAAGSAVLMQQALASTRASLDVVGGGQRPAPVPSSTSVAPATAVPATVPAGPRLRGAAPPAAAGALLGTRAEQLRRMLGEPSLRRPEGEAEIWLYEAADCRLDVILYAEGGGLVVAHAAARAHGGAEGVTEQACLSAIAAAPAPAPWTAPPEGARRA